MYLKVGYTFETECTKSRYVTVCENYAKEKGIPFEWKDERFSYEVDDPVGFNFLKSLKKFFWGLT